MPKFHSEREYMLKTIVLELYFWGSLAMELLEGHLKSASLPACSNLFFLSFTRCPLSMMEYHCFPV